jgi:hypothetical protein
MTVGIPPAMPRIAKKNSAAIHSVVS